jgi:exodeoxyribonuclease-3
VIRLLAWNIRAGGGARIARLAAAIERHDAAVLVLSEFRGGEAGRRLVAALAALGYRHMTADLPPPGRNGVLIAARMAFAGLGSADMRLPEPYRLLRAGFAGFRLCGVYLPNLRAKIPYWEALLASLAAENGSPALAIGDFNTCRAYLDEAGATDRTAYFLDRIADIGFCDLWRQRHPDTREFSWYSTRGNGFRVDHAFLSSGLAARVAAIRYSHDERVAGLSDHSPLILDLTD